MPDTDINQSLTSIILTNSFHDAVYRMKISDLIENDIKRPEKVRVKGLGIQAQMQTLKEKATLIK